MSILIRGAEMPKSCWLCPLSVLYEKPREMLFCRITKEEVLRNKVDGNCPLIEVPKHGRLIDADCCNGYFYEHMSDDMMIAAMNAINEMPTIIESDGE